MEKILIIDGDRDLCTALCNFFEKKGFLCSYSDSGQEAIKTLKKEQYDTVIADNMLQDISNADLIGKIKSLTKNVAIIITTSAPDIRAAVEVMRHGAADYIAKPFTPDELHEAINKAAVGRGNYRNGTRNLHHGEHIYLVGKSESAIKINTDIEMVAPTDLSVIIYGETGAGKECIARELHRQSKRSHMPFVSVDCSALTETLADKELFGVEDGVINSAASDATGSFKKAEGGVLFLNEAGKLPADTQAKLLHALHENKTRRDSATNGAKMDVRILVSINEEHQGTSKNGGLRDDLYHWLNEFSIHVPALRTRKEDIPVFAAHFLQLANAEFNKNIEKIAEKANDILINYRWPGNLRELKNVMRRAVLIAQNGTITDSLLPEELLIENYPVTVDAENADLKETARAAERQAIVNALAKAGNNKSKAARLLNVDRKTLYNKLKTFNLH